MTIHATTEHTAKVLVRRSSNIVVLGGSAIGEYTVHARSTLSQEDAIRQIREFGEAIVKATTPEEDE